MSKKKAKILRKGTCGGCGWCQLQRTAGSTAFPDLCGNPRSPHVGIGRRRNDPDTCLGFVPRRADAPGYILVD